MKMFAENIMFRICAYEIIKFCLRVESQLSSF